MDAELFRWDRSRSKTQQKELTLLAAVIFLEADAEPEAGKLAVGYVIMNRWRDRRRWANTIAGVILAPWQFSCLNHESGYRRVYDAPAAVWRDCFDAACQVYSENTADPTGGANHYYNPDLAEPWWAATMEFKQKIGNHLFLRD